MTPKMLLVSVLGGFVAIALVTRLQFLFPIIGPDFGE